MYLPSGFLLHNRFTDDTPQRDTAGAWSIRWLVDWQTTDFALFQIQRRRSSEHVDQRSQRKKTEPQIPFTHNSRCVIILVPKVLFASFSRRSLGTSKDPLFLVPRPVKKRALGTKMFILFVSRPRLLREVKRLMGWEWLFSFPRLLGKEVCNSAYVSLCSV